MYNLGLIGQFISKSQMPDLISKLGSEFDVQIKYQLFDLAYKKNIDLRRFIENLKKNFIGLGVTYPYKEKVLDCAEQFGEEVKLTRASNALLFKNEITARNTDFLGFLKSYNFHFNTAPKKILVIGGGGIGRAVCFGLGKLYVEKIYLIEKDKKKLKELINQLKKQEINCISLEVKDLMKIQFNLQGIINCTPIGHESSLGNPLPKLVTTKDQWVYDAVYTPAKTDFLKRAELNKSKIIYGIDLFVFQGIEAFILFTEQEKLRKIIYKKVKEIRSYYFKKLVN